MKNEDQHALYTRVAAQVCLYLGGGYVEARRQVAKQVANTGDRAAAALLKKYGQRLLRLKRELSVIQQAALMMLRDMVGLKVEPGELLGVWATAQHRIDETVQTAVDDLMRIGAMT